MDEKKSRKHRVTAFGTVRVMAFSAVLVAMSIVCGKYLAFGLGNVMRFSFENLPILMAGIMFGPAVGLAVGIIADLLGCMLVGYNINLIVTAGAASIGLLAGIFYRVSLKLPYFFRIILSVGIAHIVGSVIIKTFGLSAFYDMPFMVLLLWRVLNYVIVGAIEYSLIYFVLKNRSIRSIMLKK